MPKYKIEKDIPIPSRPYPVNVKYPWADMKVGDSFLVGEDKTTIAKATAASHNYGRRHGKKFSMRGNRIWRIK